MEVLLCLSDGPGWLRRIVGKDTPIDLTGPDETAWEQRLASVRVELGEAGRLAPADRSSTKSLLYVRNV